MTEAEQGLTPGEIYKYEFVIISDSPVQLKDILLGDAFTDVDKPVIRNEGILTTVYLNSVCTVPPPLSDYYAKITNNLQYYELGDIALYECDSNAERCEDMEYADIALQAVCTGQDNWTATPIKCCLTFLCK